MPDASPNLTTCPVCKKCVHKEDPTDNCTNFGNCFYVLADMQAAYLRYQELQEQWDDAAMEAKEEYPDND